tara:strand:+ start:796 stop:1689 length:894 start_codon:yes stop_codon:yes gene_type:complete
MLKIQKIYNQKIIGQNLTSKEIDLHTQQLALCAHAELSSLVNATNFKKHHGSLEQVDRDNILFESIDVMRYIQAIQNLWNISGEEIEEAYNRKTAYLNARLHIDNTPWTGQKVVIVDMDDVLVSFRECFAAWLEKSYNISIDVESKEYYFITALSELNINPEAVFESFVAAGGFASLTPVNNARNFMLRLKDQGYWVHILTARPETNLRCMYDTYFWLAEHNIPYDDLSFSSEKFRWCAKSKYYDDNSIAYAIDDSPKHATEYAKHGIRVKVPVKSYNKSINQEVEYYENFNTINLN